MCLQTKVFGRFVPWTMRPRTIHPWMVGGEGPEGGLTSRWDMEAGHLWYWSRQTFVVISGRRSTGFLSIFLCGEGLAGQETQYTWKRNGARRSETRIPSDILSRVSPLNSGQDGRDWLFFYRFLNKLTCLIGTGIWSNILWRVAAGLRIRIQIRIRMDPH